MATESTLKFTITADSNPFLVKVAEAERRWQGMLKGMTQAAAGIDVFGSIQKSLPAAEAAMKTAAQEAQRLGAVLQAANRAGSSDPVAKQFQKEIQRDYNASRQKAEQLRQEYERQKETLAQLGGQLARSGINTNDLAAAQAKLQEQLSRVSATARGQQRIADARFIVGVPDSRVVEQEIQKVQAAYKRLRDSGTLTPQEMAQAHLRLQDKIRESRNQTNGWADSLANAKVQLLAVGAAIYGAINVLSNTGKAFLDFEVKMANVWTIIDVGKEKLNKIGLEVRALSVNMGKSATESASALYEIYSAGVGVENGVNVLKLATKAATAGITDTKTAAHVGIGVINAYGFSINRLGWIYDVLFQLVKDGVLTFEDVAKHIGEVLPAAKSAGVGIAEVAAGMAQLTKMGILAPLAATALKDAIIALAAPAPEAKKKLQELGIVWNGLTGTLQQISKLNPPIALMREIVPNEEAMKAVLALTGAFQDFRKEVGNMDAASGVTDDAFRKIASTGRFTMDQFRSAIDELGIQLGEFVAGGTPIVGVLTEIVKWVNNLPPSVKALGGAFVGVVAATSLWYLGLNRLADALKLAVTATIAQFVPAITSIINMPIAGVLTLMAGKVMDLVMALRAMGTASAALLLTPLGGLLTGLAAAGGIAYWAVQKSNGELEKQEQLMADNNQQIAMFTGLVGELRKAGVVVTPNMAKPIFDMQRAVQSGNLTFDQGVKKARDYTDAILASAQKRSEIAFQIITKEKELATLQNSLADERKRKDKELLEAKRTNLNESLRESESAIKHELSLVEEHTKRIRELRLESSRMQESDFGRLREILRRGMSEWNQEVDRINQAYDSVRFSALAAANAQKYLKAGNIEAAMVANKDAERLAEDAKRQAESVKNVTWAYNLYANAMRASTESNKISIDIEEKLKSQNLSKIESIREKAVTTAQMIIGVQAILDSLKDEKTILISAEIEQAKTGIDLLKAQLNGIQDKTVTITTRNVETHAVGGQVGFTRGGRLPGWGGGDRISALLEAGEIVINKDRSRMFQDLLLAINFSPLSAVQKLLPGFAMGGMVGIPAFPKLAMASGGQVFASSSPSAPTRPSEIIQFNLSINNSQPFELFGSRDRVRQLRDDLSSLQRGR
ncbi:MAG: phage tail tape measure protein [Nitrospirae bacterium]|nr:phage tail tape measure protein [Magnetococcales bacterium]HAT48858.1 phage tail tape measure protein [Alphaproteobacteria bacterium]